MTANNSPNKFRHARKESTLIITQEPHLRVRGYLLLVLDFPVQRFFHLAIVNRVWHCADALRAQDPVPGQQFEVATIVFILVSIRPFRP